MKIDQPHKPLEVKLSRSTMEEVAYNAEQWSKLAQKNVPDDVGFVMAIFLKGQKPGETEYVVANIPQEGVKMHLKAISDKMRGERFKKFGKE